MALNTVFRSFSQSGVIKAENLPKERFVERNVKTISLQNRAAAHFV